MATTPAEVCNIALARIGQREFIDSLDEATVAAEVCKVLYGDARDAALASFPWPFATRRQALAQLASITRSGWEFVYSLPADLLSARYIWSGSRTPASENRIKFALEDDASYGRVLLTDREEAELVYTAKMTAVPSFPPLFMDALAWRLAADLALALPVKPNTGMAMEQKYRAALAQAAAADANQSEEDQPPDSEFVRAR